METPRRGCLDNIMTLFILALGLGLAAHAVLASAPLNSIRQVKTK